MRRLLQFGTFLLLIATIAAPISEWFDRWDAPGISNDVEFAVFALILTLCLVLLVSKLVAALALVIRLALLPDFQRAEEAAVARRNSLLDIFVPPMSPPPLRI
jgi:hypothetical protein